MMTFFICVKFTSICSTDVGLAVYYYYYYLIFVLTLVRVTYLKEPPQSLYYNLNPAKKSEINLLIAA